MSVNNKLQHFIAIEDEAQLPDLGVTDEEGDRVTGGPGLPGSQDGGGHGMGGDWLINHNEMMISDKEGEAQLNDLRLSDEEEDRIKGGPDLPCSQGGGGRTGGGDFIMNHNETMVSDKEAEAHLNDLGPTDEVGDRVTGGPGHPGSEDGGGGIGGDWVINHNETMLTGTQD